MNWINTVNTTNLKIVVGCFAFLQLVTAVIVFEYFGRHFNEVLFLECAGLVTAWASVSYLQFAKKRDTTIITPPDVPAENATATTTTRVVDDPAAIRVAQTSVATARDRTRRQPTQPVAKDD